MLIVYTDLGPGWSPIAHMARLCAELMEAEFLVLDAQTSASRLQERLAYLPRRKGDETCLLITGGPQHLPLLFRVEGWRRRFNHIAAWVIDGFWTEYIPHVVRFRSMFDQFFITTEEDVCAWETLTGRPAKAIPWGSDVLRLGSNTVTRPVDLMRVGRQPAEWDDDATTAAEALKRQLRFAGRPPEYGTQHSLLMRSYSESKFVLAFSNTAHKSSHTHPTRAYVTGRWTDSLAAGASVAGVAPRSRAADALFWPGAILELDSLKRDKGLEIIATAVRSWHPGLAANNYLKYLQRLDWRWRFVEIAERLGARPSLLFEEVAQLKACIEKAGN